MNLGDQLIFMNYNVKPYHTRLVQGTLENQNITRPVMSPAMNPIQNMQDYIPRAIYIRNNLSKSTGIHFQSERRIIP